MSGSQNARGTSSVKRHGVSEARLRTSSINPGVVAVRFAALRMWRTSEDFIDSLLSLLFGSPGIDPQRWRQLH